MVLVLARSLRLELQQCQAFRPQVSTSTPQAAVASSYSRLQCVHQTRLHLPTDLLRKALPQLLVQGHELLFSSVPSEFTSFESPVVVFEVLDEAADDCSQVSLARLAALLQKEDALGGLVLEAPHHFLMEHSLHLLMEIARHLLAFAVCHQEPRQELRPLTTKQQACTPQCCMVVYSTSVHKCLKHRRRAQLKRQICWTPLAQGSEDIKNISCLTDSILEQQSQRSAANFSSSATHVVVQGALNGSLGFPSVAGTAPGNRAQRQSSSLLGAGRTIAFQGSSECGDDSGASPGGLQLSLVGCALQRGQLQELVGRVLVRQQPREGGHRQHRVTFTPFDPGDDAAQHSSGEVACIESLLAQYLEVICFCQLILPRGQEAPHAG
mmetsp:Transcript_15402/g.27540  ORF Transcript_15402/g.27540 Transcript_15402/m.27540 type:complete len:381 (+) Transcript_15402:214-1356(+)